MLIAYYDINTFDTYVCTYHITSFKNAYFNRNRCLVLLMLLDICGSLLIERNGPQTKLSNISELQKIKYIFPPTVEK